MGYDDVQYTTLTGTNDYSATVQGPVDGYRAFVATVNTGLQTLISNDVYLNGKINDLETYNPLYVPLFCPINIYSGIWDSAQNTSATTQVWRRDVTSGYLNRGMINGQAHTTDVGKLFMSVPAYQGRGAYIASVVASVYGPNSTLPENMPYIKLYHTYNAGTPASVLVSGYTGEGGTGGVDTSATQSEFIQRHNITLTWASGSRPLINGLDGHNYFLELSPGWGASHVSGLNLVSAYISFTNEE